MSEPPSAAPESKDAPAFGDVPTLHTIGQGARSLDELISALIANQTARRRRLSSTSPTRARR